MPVLAIVVLLSVAQKAAIAGRPNTFLRGVDRQVELRGDNGAIDATGRFQLRGVIGRALFRTGYMRFDVAVARWALKSVTLNGNDITDTPIDIQAAGDITGIEITLIDASHISRDRSRTHDAKPLEITSSSSFPNV